MYEQDYIMRIIKDMIRVFLKLFFNIETETPTEQLLKDAMDRRELYTLWDMADNGQIDDAENRLFELSEDEDNSRLEIALLFYSHLNEKSDEFLEEHNFSREEIASGLRDIASEYGVAELADRFLSD